MDYVLDTLLSIELMNPLEALWFVLVHGGWILLAIVFIKGLILLWLDEIQGAYFADIQFMHLAINVPRQTEQSPKAVENIFSHLIGLSSAKPDFIEKYWKGKISEHFAVEIVSRSGYIHYHVFLPAKYRDVFEAAIFAQYPDAEISEVTDYLNELPKSWPDERYDMWGGELALIKAYPYPIKTHQAFVDQVSGLLKDPLASLLEFLSTLRPGEEAYIQIPLLPGDEKWRAKSDEEVKKLIGARVEVKKNNFQKILHTTFSPLHTCVETLIPFLKLTVGEKEDKKEEQLNKMQFLTPGERSVVEQIQIKASKSAFMTKIRVMYVAPKEIFNKSRAQGGILGAFKQVSTTDVNGFKIDSFTKLSAKYFFAERRLLAKQNWLWRAYRNRSLGSGGTPYYLNTEELATIWHFPMIDTKAPLVSKAVSKRAEPPSRLPVRETPDYAPGLPLPPLEEKKDELPDNLPFA